MKNRYCKYLLIILLWSNFLGIGLSQEKHRIENLRPFLSGDTLKCEFANKALFSGKIGQTLLSGLPVLIELRLRVITDAGKQIPAGFLKYRISYDIWEDRYLMEMPGRHQQFNSMENLSAWWNPLKMIPLVPLQKISREKTVKVGIAMRVILVSRSQSKKLKDWVLNPYETEEDLPSLDRDAGFKLNLNHLLSMFFGKDDAVDSFETRQVSAPLDLPQNPRE